MVRELQSRVSALEAKEKSAVVTTIEAPAPDYLAWFQKVADEQKKPERKMCPKCGVKPAYFFHVRTCTGQKEEQKDAEPIRRRDQGTT
jgi:DNA-directed RNA polymerase subunit M/transcription elongation factor TFIIS